MNSDPTYENIFAEGTPNENPVIGQAPEDRVKITNAGFSGGVPKGRVLVLSSVDKGSRMLLAKAVAALTSQEIAKALVPEGELYGPVVLRDQPPEKKNRPYYRQNQRW